MNFYYAVSAINSLSNLLAYLFLTIILILFILSVISWWILFKRNNQKGWKVIIPFYNIYVLGKISNLIGVAILSIVTIIFPIVFTYGYVNKLNVSFYRSGILFYYLFFIPFIELSGYFLILFLVYVCIQKLNKSSLYCLFFALFPFLFVFSIKKLPTLPKDGNNNSNIDAVNNLLSMPDSSVIVDANNSSNNLPIIPQPIDDLNQPQANRDNQN